METTRWHKETPDFKHIRKREPNRDAPPTTPPKATLPLEEPQVEKQTENEVKATEDKTSETTEPKQLQTNLDGAYWNQGDDPPMAGHRLRNRTILTTGEVNCAEATWGPWTNHQQ